MRTCLYTYCSKAYIEGLDKALSSMKAHNDLDNIDIIIASFDIDNYPGAKVIKPLSEDWTKYAIDGFLLDYDRVAYFQSDELYLGSIDYLLRGDLKPFAYVANGEWGGPCLYNGVKHVHTGGMVIHPKLLPNAHAQLKAISEDTNRDPCGRPANTDQDYFTEWLYKYNIDFEVLPHIYSMAKRYYVKDRDTWDKLKSDIRVLHYVGSPKPWEGDEFGYESLGGVWRRGAF